MPSQRGSFKIDLIKVFISYFLNGIATAIAQDRFWKSVRPPLIDIAFNSLPEIDSAAIVADMIVFSLTVFAATTVYFAEDRVFVFHMVSDIVMYFFMARALLLVGTFYPSPMSDAVQKCLPPSQNRAEIIYRAFRYIFNFGARPHSKILCGGPLLTGHVGLMAIFGWVIVKFSPPYFSSWLRYAVGSSTIIGVVCLSLSHGDYTVAIFYAAIISYGIIKYVSKKSGIW